MWKRKLNTPVYTILRKARASTPHRPTQSASEIVHSTSATKRAASISSDGQCFSAPRIPTCELGSLRTIVFATSFCSRSARDSSPKCWNCAYVARTSPFLVCESCWSVQPVDESVDYFQIFGLEKKYDLEDRGLEGKYKDWQKKLHPDLVHTKSEQEKEYAAEQSARVIDAYRTLGDPLSRAIYVLKLEGVNVDEEETVSEPELLMEILEIREAVDEAANSQALSQIQSQMEDKLRHWSESFANSIHSRKFEDALACVRRMKYYSRVNEEIKKKL